MFYNLFHVTITFKNYLKLKKAIFFLKFPDQKSLQKVFVFFLIFSDDQKIYAYF